MQTIMIMAVGALVLMAVGGLFGQISPKIRNYVQAALGGNSGAVGSNGFNFSGGGTNGGNALREGGTSLPPKMPSWGNSLVQAVTTLAKERNRMLETNLLEAIEKTLPTELAAVEGLIDDILAERATLDPLSDQVRRFDDLLAELRRLGRVELEDMMRGMEDTLKINGQLAPFLSSLGSMFGTYQMLQQDSANQALGRDPDTTLQQAYQAYESTFQISGSLLADGIWNRLTGGTKGPNSWSGVGVNVGAQVALGQAAESAGQHIARDLFPAFNRMAYWLHDNGYSPRPPRFPRDFQPPP